MRRMLIIASLAGSLIVFALSVNLFDTLFMFIFFGVVPFKSEPIPADEMLLVYIVAGAFVLAYALRGSKNSLLHFRDSKPSRANVS